MNKAVKEEQNV